MLDITKSALMVIDVQGRLARRVHESEWHIHRMATLIKAASILNLPIVWVEQNTEKLGSTVSELALLLHGHVPAEKMTFNALAEPAIADLVQQSSRQQWILCGIETHICVYQTAMALFQQGKEVEVVSDAVTSRHEREKLLALNKLQVNGVGVTSVEMCLYELLGDCQHPGFKPILELIK